MSDFFAFKDFPLFVFALIGVAVASLIMYGIRNSEENWENLLFWNVITVTNYLMTLQRWHFMFVTFIIQVINKWSRWIKLSSKKVNDYTIASINPRLVTIYELLRKYKVSHNKATTLATELFLKLPPESQVPSKHEVEEFVKKRQTKIWVFKKESLFVTGVAVLHWQPKVSSMSGHRLKENGGLIQFVMTVGMMEKTKNLLE